MRNWVGEVIGSSDVHDMRVFTALMGLKDPGKECR
jgi:hypothetical protein